MATAEQLPGPLGAALLDAARGAFVQALQLTAWIGAALMAGTVVLVAAMRRQARSAV